MGWDDLIQRTDRVVSGVLGDATVVYTPGVGSHVTVTGIFDNVFQAVDTGQAGVSSSGPQVFLQLSDLPTDPETDAAATVTIKTVVYTPYEVRKDAQGGVLLMLHKAS